MIKESLYTLTWILNPLKRAIKEEEDEVDDMPTEEGGVDGGLTKETGRMEETHQE